MVVITPEGVYEELKQLPASDLARAAEFVHQLHAAGSAERRALLRSTHGAFSPEEADEIERAIEQGCEQIDAERW